MNSIMLTRLADEYDLKLLTQNVNVRDKLISHPEINRPALQLAGFYDYFDRDRIQLIGKVEHAYLSTLSFEVRRETLEKLFACRIPTLIFSRNLAPFPEALELAEKYDVPVYQYDENTAEFIGESIRWLRVQLAEQITMHGVLVDVFGEGILIMGESGIGKSEMALELIQRGHRLVADDAVEIRRVSQQTLIGQSPEVIRYMIELRGIGIIDVRRLFGIQSVRETMSIDLIIKLEVWENDHEYDRLGLHNEYTEILGNKIVSHSIPIRPGRNLAIICESAAINHRQKKMGYNAAATLNQRIEESIARQFEEEGEA